MEHWFYWSLFLHLFNQATTLNPSRTLFFTRWCVEEGRCLQGRRSGLTLELGWTTGAHPGGVRKKEGLHWLLTPAKCCKESDMTEQLNWSVFKSVFPNLLQVVAHTEKEKFIRCNGGTQKALKSPLDSKEIQPVHPNGNQSWIFIGRTDAETPILWPPDVKGWLIGKDPDDGKDWRQEEKGMIEDEMVGWHHRLKGHEFG